MKHIVENIIASILIISASIPAFSVAADTTIPWAANSGVPESGHVAATGEDLNALHHQVTNTQEGVWAKNTGSIHEDEKSLLSMKGKVISDPHLMPHEG